MKKSFLLVIVIFCFQMGSAQQASIKGVVQDEHRNPLPFASIQVEHSFSGVAADRNGKFEIQLKPGNYLITASSIGFHPVSKEISISISEEKQLVFTLTENHEALEEVEVFGSRFDKPDKIEMLTGLPLKPYEQIQSISIISSKLIEQQGNLSISQATKNVPGVYTFATYGNKRESMSSRGFRGIPILKNGVRVHSDFRGVGILTDMEGVDNIQVLKGAAAITQGVATDLGSPGGVINIVTKTPKYYFGGNASLRAGSYGSFRPTFDIFGPLNEKKTVAFRIDGAYQTANSFRKGVSSERFYINPSLEWLIDEKSTLTLEMDYFNDERTPDLGTINMAADSINAIYDLPYDKFLGFKNDRSKTENTSFAIRIDRQLTDQLKLKAGFFQSYLDLDDHGASLGDVVLQDEKPIYNIRNRGYSSSTRSDNNSVFRLNLVGDQVDIGIFQHTFQVGFDYRENKFDTYSQSVSNVDEINIFEDIEHQLPNHLDFDSPKLGGATSKAWGLVAQDVVSFTSWLKTFFGIRYCHTKTITNDETTSSEAINPLVGLVFSPMENINFFGSFTNSSYPRTAARLDENGEALGNERFDQLETGIKTNWLDSRLRFNFTFFKINNRNINLPVYDENWVPTGFYEKGGNDERKGIELELTGRILPNLDVIAGYAYIDAKYKKHTSYVFNSAPLNTPSHTFNVYANYRFDSGILKNTSLGAGAYYTGKRPINDWSKGPVTHQGIIPNQKPFDVAAYTLVNFQAAYQINNHWNIRFLADNIFDEIGYNAYRTRYINQTQPRSFAGVIQYSF